MLMEETGGADRAITADFLLDAAEQALLRAEFDVVRPLLQRLHAEFGAPDTYPAAVRYDTLLGALAGRAGNWPEAVRRCPESPVGAETGAVHSLAVSALRELAHEGRHTDTGVAAIVIVLWAYLLDEEDLGDFRTLLTERRGAPVPDALWEQGLGQLRGRVADLLHALDVRAGRDVLTAWSTAWEAECQDGTVIFADVPTDAGPHALISLEEAAWYLVDHRRGADLLAAYEARHPEADGWPADLPGHDAVAAPLARAIANRGRERALSREWSEALADLDAAVWLGHTLVADERAAVRDAGKNIGRSRTGRGDSPLVRIAGLEQAHALLPRDATLAAELTAELVAEGQRKALSDPARSRSRFVRALEVTAGDPDARAGLDGHLRADLVKVLDGTYTGGELSVDEVLDLLAREPDCAEARSWLGDHYRDQAVAAAARGCGDEALSAVRESLRYGEPPWSHGGPGVDGVLSDLLVVAARRSDSGTRAGMERRVELLHTASAVTPGHPDRFGEDLETALLHLAEHLEATGTPTDVIELFLRDRMRTGISARFDQIVETAYLNRARARERAGDPGGALRDHACAKRVGAGLPDQGFLFGPGPAPRRRRPAPDEQDTLF
ncbi:hypothetical protein [Streptomyces cyaneofuscatus]|uniref:hypothetical protein n=1 Tax=Streptomyces cyaneofuscatus TaxID=66883 RepID=UPI0013DA94FE|nr:hypothetical protein [Streptomyces cyaneofuscatus]NDZ63404.1 hypothetical protein [Streptomyces cyaneofuscatus]